ncbi:MAG: metallophosphoesterase family protein [Euryarchaeota archaeon]|nr:metallophosphoesterase family protein [Euryarchaeota archaeon]
MITVISDIHGNLEALEEVLAHAEGDIYCCGDFVGYGPNPNEVIELCIERNVQGVMGNHDHAVLHEPRGFNVHAQRAISWTNSVLNQESRKFLKELQFGLTMEKGGKKISIYHGSPTSITQYLYPSYPDSYFRKFLYGIDILMLGHTHIPMTKTIGNKLVLNPGSVGQPRDKDPRASMLFLSPEKMSCEIRRMEYSKEKYRKKIIKNNLPDFLWQRLYSGL